MITKEMRSLMTNKRRKRKKQNKQEWREMKHESRKQADKGYEKTKEKDQEKKRQEQKKGNEITDNIEKKKDENRDELKKKREDIEDGNAGCRFEKTDKMSRGTKQEMEERWWHKILWRKEWCTEKVKIDWKRSSWRWQNEDRRCNTNKNRVCRNGTSDQKNSKGKKLE